MFRCVDEGFEQLVAYIQDVHILNLDHASAGIYLLQSLRKNVGWYDILPQFSVYMAWSSPPCCIWAVSLTSLLFCDCQQKCLWHGHIKTSDFQLSLSNRLNFLYSLLPTFMSSLPFKVMSGKRIPCNCNMRVKFRRNGFPCCFLYLFLRQLYSVVSVKSL